MHRARSPSTIAVCLCTALQGQSRQFTDGLQQKLKGLHSKMYSKTALRMEDVLERKEKKYEELLDSEKFSLQDPSAAPRSALFIPCSNKKALKKIPSLDADVLILDLEDSVPHGKKVEARDNMYDTVESGSLDGKRVVVRINSPSYSPAGFQDLDALGALHSKIEGVAIPKTGVDDYDKFGELLHPEHKLWAFFETPQSIIDAEKICASGKYHVAVMGLNDLRAEMRLPLSFGGTSSSRKLWPGVPPRWNMHYAMSKVIMAACANNMAILDGVFNDPTNAPELLAELQEGFQMGFQGKTLIHPSQIKPTNEIFTPTEEEAEWASRVVKAVQGSAGGGAVVLDGQMVEDLHAWQAIRIMQRRKAAVADKTDDDDRTTRQEAVKQGDQN